MTCCGNVLCKSCLDQLKRSAKQSNFKFTCPVCRNSSESNQYFKDRRAEREIKSLNVYCMNIDDGCDWTGEFLDVMKHFDKCPYRLLSCENGCGATIKLCDLKKYLHSHCLNRKYMCSDCQLTSSLLMTMLVYVLIV